jgi:hypothetical protein
MRRVPYGPIARADSDDDHTASRWPEDAVDVGESLRIQHIYRGRRLCRYRSADAARRGGILVRDEGADNRRRPLDAVTMLPDGSI